MTNGQIAPPAVRCLAVRASAQLQHMDTREVPAYRLEPRWRAVRNRILQVLAQMGPGHRTLRVRLHRARGVNIGANVYIDYDVILETAHPELITIEDDAQIGVRVTVMAHFGGAAGVTIERGAFLDTGVIVMPSVVVGHGAVVTAGSVVTRSIPPLTLARGNPAVPVAALSEPIGHKPKVDFYRSLRPLRSSQTRSEAGSADRV